MSTPINQTDPAFATLSKALRDLETSWSIGTFGAIAEFFHSAQFPTRIEESATHLSAKTELGQLTIEWHDDLRLMPYEGLSKITTAWTQGVLVCLPETIATLNPRNGIHEIEPERSTLKTTTLRPVTFDLGLDVAHLEACIRTVDPELISVLRSHPGMSLFSKNPPLSTRIKSANPVRSFRTKVACIEIYQDIPEENEETPLGPHTHISERLLSRNQTQAATIPVTQGWVAVLAFYPPNPARDLNGELTAFSLDRHLKFQSLLMKHGSPEFTDAKLMFAEAMVSKSNPEDCPLPQSKNQRTAVRIAIRQHQHVHGDSQLLARWRKAYEPEGRQ